MAATENPEDLADKILAAADSGRPLGPFTDADPAFDLAQAYAVAAAILRRRQAGGARPVGWKIGFTNRTIWNEYGVHAPIWGPMYANTVAALEPSPLAGEGWEGGRPQPPASQPSHPIPTPLGGLQQPRLEPEIVLRLARAPEPGMDERALIDCVDGVGHGIELVQSLFPDWRFRGADTVAAFALHGRYRHGALIPVTSAERDDWRAALEAFTIVLERDSEEVDRGDAKNILGGGPLTALRHFVDGLPSSRFGLTLAPGDLITTGTLTRAFPVAAGERWTTRLKGIPLQGLDVVFD